MKAIDVARWILQPRCMQSAAARAGERCACCGGRPYLCKAFDMQLPGGQHFCVALSYTPMRKWLVVAQETLVLRALLRPSVATQHAELAGHELVALPRLARLTLDCVRCPQGAGLAFVTVVGKLRQGSLTQAVIGHCACLLIRTLLNNRHRLACCWDRWRPCNSAIHLNSLQGTVLMCLP